MEEKQSEVKLFGMWASGYCTRVVLALKAKGIPYKYIEEDLKNKSELLLRYNPVHKKVPLLLHNGRPVAESLIILEYIDEYWNHSPKLLPDDPYKRAKVRFWADFYDRKLKEGTVAIMTSRGKEKEKAIESFLELLKVFEEGIAKDFPEKLTFSNSQPLDFLDIVIGSSACNYEAYNEAVAVVVDPKRNPLFFQWMTALKECPLMKESLPPHDKLVAKMKSFQSPSV